MTSRSKPRSKKLSALACAALLAFVAVILVHAQSTPNAQTLRAQLRPRYDIVALQDGVALVPRQRQAEIRIVEVRNGGVAINGSTVSAQEARQRLGQDADAILRITYLDAAAQHELARPDSAAPSASAGNPDNGNQLAPPQRTQTHGGDLVHIGGGVNVGRDELIQGNVVAIGGSADVDGEVMRDVTVIGGSLNLGPDAVVHGNIAVIGGSLDRSPGARVDGKLDNVGIGAQFPFGRRFARNPPPFRGPVFRAGSFVGTLFRMILLLLAALIVTALGGRFVEAIADRASAEPLRAGLTGLLAEVLFVPLVILTVVVLAVSIIGIPLLLLVPFGIVLAVVLMLIGFTGIACRVGRFVGDRFGLSRGPYASVALGVLLLVVLTLVAKLIGLAGGLGSVIGLPFAAIGYLAEYLAWTVGIGALILTWLGSRHHAAPPSAASSSAAPAPPAAPVA